MSYYEKTILTCYTSLSSMIEQIENVIKKRARNSFYDFQSTEIIANKILALCNVRFDLIDLKQRTESCLEKLNEEDRTLIEYKYFQILPKDENFDHTSRNYFRKQIRALDRFSKILTSQGITKEWFDNKYMKISYISSLYNKIVKEEGKKHTI